MSITPLAKKDKAIIKCPVCDRTWEGRLRENISCSRMHGGCGSKFVYKGFKVQKIRVPDWFEWKVKETKPDLVYRTYKGCR
jgi:hypothetical protein